MLTSKNKVEEWPYHCNPQDNFTICRWSRADSPQASLERPRKERARRYAGPSRPQGLLRVKRVGMRLANYDIRALSHAQSIGVVNNQMDCADPLLPVW